MAVTQAEREKQMKDAEELLFSGPQKLGFAKALFYGRFAADWVMPYPQIKAEEKAESDALVDRVRQFANEKIDAAAIDRNAEIPPGVVRGLAEIGVFSVTSPKEYGGLGLSQMSYCRMLEEVGRACASTSILVNVQHTIGVRAILMYGTEEQKKRWLPGITTAQVISAFALTEAEAGSDAGNVQTTATPSEDGTHYIINGTKRYITSGARAGVITLMARTPDPKKPEGSVTAFLVTPDMPGFEVVDPNMQKMGIRGTAQAKLAFKDMKVPAENILGQKGRGLHVALSVLNFGRTVFGACCTGAAKSALELSVRHANTRKQFKQSLGEFELVQEKIGRMAEWVYAMEAMTTVTASIIDRGLEDYMLETAMLKVYTSEALWKIVDDTFQVHGGAAYFTDQPVERMMRDHRINLVAEGANEVMLAFIALVGMRGPGETMKALADRMKTSVWSNLGDAMSFGGKRIGAFIQLPAVPVKTPALQPYANNLGRLIRKFENAVFMMMVKHREALLDKQLLQARIANAAMEIFASACALSRLDLEMQRDNNSWDLKRAPEHIAADSFLRHSARRAYDHLAGLKDNEDDARLKAAQAALKTP